MENMQKTELLEKIKATTTGVLNDSNIELIDIVYRREGKRRILRILADTETGITMGECAKMNGLIGEVLDKEGLIDESYILEVSSPGLDRPLRTKGDFLRMKGKKIRIYTYVPIEGKKEFLGAVQVADDAEVTILGDDTIITKIPLDKISKALLNYESLL